MAIHRREFFRALTAAGAGLALARLGKAAGELQPTSAGSSDELNVALIGAGAQGRVLIEACMRIPGIRFKAVCDIWEYSRGYAERYLKKYGHAVTAYEDYRELLEKEKNLHAAIVATPDWMHAEQANACMQAGLHVYCEKEMSNTLEKARSMVETARATGKRLQIGHQRRSNPRYLHAIDTLIHDTALLGRVTHASGQWNRAKAEDLDWPKKYPMEPAKLEQYGYASMTEFRNWRWYKKYGGGPIVDLGSHQIDIFSWLWGCNPRSVMASGGIDYYEKHEWYDNVMCIYEYETKQGVARAMYQTLTTTKHGGFYETFMGENGTIVLSEVPQFGNVAEREEHAPKWDEWVRKGLLLPLREAAPKPQTRNVLVDVRVTAEAGKWPLPVELAKPAHQPHLENFFDSVRKGVPLNCPAEVGYETAVAVLAANRAVEAGKRLEFQEKDFRV